MKTTIDILATSAGSSPYWLPDLSVVHAGEEDPLGTHSWPELRRLIYGEAGM